MKKLAFTIAATIAAENGSATYGWAVTLETRS